MKIKFPVGTTEENNQLMLPEGFISIDRDKKGIRIHDGLTQGGFEVVGKQAYFNPWTLSSTNDIPARRHHVSVVCEGKIYETAGWGLSNTSGSTYTRCYNPLTNTWVVGAAIPSANAHSTAAAIGDKIYVYGGTNGASMELNVRNTLRCYDTIENTWTLLTGNLRLYQHAMVAINGKLYVHGGKTYGGTTQTSTYCYDPMDDTWSNLAVGPQLFSHGATVLNDKMYVYGGSSVGLWCYDPAADLWTKVNLTTPPTSQSTPLVAIDGKLYTQRQSIIRQYDIDTDLWTGLTLGPWLPSDPPVVSHGGKMYISRGDHFSIYTPAHDPLLK